MGLGRFPGSKCAAAGDQVDDENHNGYHEQKMDQAAGDVQAESQEPKHNENYEDRPKHGCLFRYKEHPERLESNWVLVRVPS